MAKPLRWNSPAFVWNASGVFWNGVEPRKTPMNNVKAIVDFSGYAAADLLPVAQMIHTKMVANVATFATPMPTMTVLASAISDYMAKLTARESNATSDILAFNVARIELEGDLGDLGNYVNIVANGDPVIVDLSGFPSYPTTRVPDYSAPPAPTDLRLRFGDVSGSIIARYKVARGRSMNQLQTCIGDPNLEAYWHDAGLFSGGKATLGGLTPGATVWVRVRTIGLQSVMGAWSDPAKIMVV